MIEELWKPTEHRVTTFAWPLVLLATASILAGCDGDDGPADAAARDGGRPSADAGDMLDAAPPIDAPMTPDAGPCGGPCSGATPVCDPSSGACVMCLDDGDCGDATPACDPVSNACVGCLGDEHCSTEEPVCDAAAAECVECLSVSDCDDGNHCTVDACEADRTCSHAVQPDCVAVLGLGDRHSCLVRAGGAVECWGANEGGQLGDGSMDDRLAPVSVTGIADAVDVGAGSFHTCVARATGDVACFGRSSNGRLGIPTPAASMYATPQPVGFTDAVQVEADRDHSCALHSSGSVSCWGLNGSGRLGDGTLADSETPVTVVGLSDAVAVAVGSGHSCALRSGGTVACWGRNNRGQLGDGTTSDAASPVEVTGLTDAVELWAGGFATCALRAGGDVACWGFNAYGQLGDGTTDDRSAPVAVASLGATEAGVGRDFACGRRTAGQVACWGRDDAGQLGDGEPRANSAVPVDVSGLADALVLGVGGGHACALRATGAVVCWGSNASGQLGDGTAESRSAPVEVSAP